MANVQSEVNGGGGRLQSGLEQHSSTAGTGPGNGTKKVWSRTKKYLQNHKLKIIL